jgi:hypothetical protein
MQGTGVRSADGTARDDALEHLRPELGPEIIRHRLGAYATALLSRF